MLVYVLASPLVLAAAMLLWRWIITWGCVVAPTAEEIREHNAYLRAWRTDRDRRAWERDLGIPAFGQREAPAEARAESRDEVAGAILCRRRPR